MKVLDLIRKEKKSLKLLRSRIRINLSFVEFEEEKEIPSSFTVASQTAKFMATVHDLWFCLFVGNSICL